MITGIAHACYIVKDLNATQDFYCNKLGLKLAFDFVRDGQTQRHGMYLHAGGRGFLEFFTGKLEAPVKGQSYGHICLEVDDLEKTVAALRAAGVECTPVKLGSDQSWQSWLADPDGNKIELHGYTAKSWQKPFLK